MPEIVSKTGWRVRIRKATASQSSTIQTINYNLKISSTERSKHLRQVGEQIFRPKLSEDAEVSLMTLGGFSQVGRSCMLLTTHESKILIDCGINPGARNPIDAYPRLDWPNITLD
jgi:predicted metal-dependent RNase